MFAVKKGAATLQMGPVQAGNSWETAFANSKTSSYVFGVVAVKNGHLPIFKSRRRLSKQIRNPLGAIVRWSVKDQAWHQESLQSVFKVGGGKGHSRMLRFHQGNAPEGLYRTRGVLWSILKERFVQVMDGLSAKSKAGSASSKSNPDELTFCEQCCQLFKGRGLVLLIVLLLISAASSSALHPTWALTEENLIFLEAWRIVDRAYVDKSFNGQSWFRYRENALRQEPMGTREETYTAIRKMLATLDDPFTRFLEPDKLKSLRSGTSGAVTGVGLEVGYDISAEDSGEGLVVIAPVPGGPAARAGLKPGDVLIGIDGVPTQGMGLYDAARRLQGPVNSEVIVTVQSSATKAPKRVAILRDNVTFNPVTWELCEIPSVDRTPLKLGYINLSTFNQNSSRAVKEAIENLRSNGATAFVLDIRNNSGGLFPAGVEIAKMWLDKGVIVYIADSMGVRDIYEANGEGAISTTEPLTVLVNKGTASASEILAGALKDNKRALIIGERTFGKGRIQSIFELLDGSGMAVTIARYLTPAHINIDKVTHKIMPKPGIVCFKKY